MDAINDSVEFLSLESHSAPANKVWERVCGIQNVF